MSRAATGGHSSVRRLLRERRRPYRLTWRLAALLMAMTGAIAIAGWHTHSHSHGALQVSAADGTSIEIPEWRVGATTGGEPATLPAGELRFELTNTDTVAHDFVLIRTEGPAGELPLKDGQVDLAGAGQLAGQVQAFAPGQSGEASFRVDPGTYVLFCNIPGHYSGGMYYSLTVR